MLAHDRVAAAIGRLDAPRRALLELSIRRGLGEEEIASVLRIEPAEVVRRREEAVALLGSELGVGEERRGELREQLSALEAEHWRAGAPPPDLGNGRPPAGRTQRRRPLAIGLTVLAAGSALAVGIALGGEDEPDRTAPAGPTPAPDRPEAKPGGARERRTGPEARPRRAVSAGPVRSMRRLNGTNGRGTAQLRRERGRAELRLRVSGFLRPSGGGYAVWLFNSRNDARRLYATTARAIRRDIALPRDFTRYRFVEVARAVPGLRSRHSGVTLLRVRVSALRGAGRR